MLVLWGLITHGTSAGTGDEPHYQMIAHSVVFDRDLDVANNYADTSNLIFDGGLEAGTHARPGRDGTVRPVHDIGMPIVFAPYFAVAYELAGYAAVHVPKRLLDRARLNGWLMLRHLLSFAMIGITAWIAVHLFETFGALSGQPTRAALWAALVVLSPPILSHSFLFFTEILTAAIVLGVVLRLRRSDLSAIEVVVLGLATGYLMLIHARNAGLCVGLMAVAAWRFWKSERNHAWQFLGAAIAMLMVRSAVTFYFWGTWITTPHARLGIPQPVGSQLVEAVNRVLGLLFDQSHGLIFVAPIFVLLPIGWARLWRRDRMFALQIAVVVLAYMVPVALPILNAHGWRGGWAPAARFLVPIVPLLAIVMFSAVASVPRSPKWVIALIVMQIGIDAVFWQRPRLMWNEGENPHASALYSYLDGESGAITSWLPLFPGH